VRALRALPARLRPLVERLDALAVRERALLFLGGVVLICLAWQSLLMDPLSVRTRLAQQQLTETTQSMQALEQTGAAAVGDPLVAAAGRNQALIGRQAQLDGELKTLAQGYVSPERVAELLQQILAGQHGLKLIRLANLPVESLSRAETNDADPAAAGGSSGHAAAVGTRTGSAGAGGGAEPPAAIPASDRGPYLHPVEIVVEGDYASIVAYLHALEDLPWRIHWQQLELSPGPDAVNHVRIVIGALSLSRNWMSV